MSRAETRRGARNGTSARKGKGRHPVWIVGVAVTAALLVVAVFAQSQRGADHHPTPRALELASDVVASTRYEAYPRVEQAYTVAAAVPHVLDGLFCYCHCSEHSGHYSLLDCFASDHAASCDVCMSEAVIAHDMTQQGASLDEIRTLIDRNYST